MGFKAWGGIEISVSVVGSFEREGRPDKDQVRSRERNMLLAIEVAPSTFVLIFWKTLVGFEGQSREDASFVSE